MTDQTLDGTTDQPGPNPFVKPEPSIVDTILDLDAFLSADVRRAELMARFCTRPDLEADLQALEAELDNLTDAQGKPLAGAVDASLGEDSDSPALTKAREIQELRHAYAAAFRSIRMRAMSSDDWSAFQDRHRKVLDGDPPYAKTMWDDLITRCAVAPAVNQEQLTKLRAALGPTAVNELQATAWQVNVASGVSVPKSPLSSAVLRQSRPARS